jgi:hypothetical protein
MTIHFFSPIQTAQMHSPGVWMAGRRRGRSFFFKPAGGFFLAPSNPKGETVSRSARRFRSRLPGRPLLVCLSDLKIYLNPVQKKKMTSNRRQLSSTRSEKEIKISDTLLVLEKRHALMCTTQCHYRPYTILLQHPSMFHKLCTRAEENRQASTVQWLDVA